jgi:hypothetical protein
VTETDAARDDEPLHQKAGFATGVAVVGAGSTKLAAAPAARALRSSWDLA